MAEATRRMFYHQAEWVLNHPRFGLFMLALIAASFVNHAALAAILFVFFTAEIIVRIKLIRHKLQTYPYRGSTHRKLDWLFLMFDIVGVLSLLVTVFQFAIPVEDATLARVLRAVYLLRTLRIFRYIDLQSAIYSPTYGMVISLLVLLSFFVEGVGLWIVLMFFFVELIVRWMVMRDTTFPSRRTKLIEWGFWWLDLVATFAMLPGLPVNQFGTILRSLRLIRLFRPWVVILSNLKQVVKEGQYFQEINLIMLLLAVFSIAGGVVGHYFLGPFDFTHDGVIDETDHGILAQIWFSFRTFTDPGNVVFYPETNAMTIYSIFAVVIGVFVFAFFIGIGANIVSGLMHKLRNERMNIANHMVLLGWNEATPFVLRELRAMSMRSFTRMKVVLLNPSREVPAEFQQEDWVSFRWGDMERSDDLRRVNLSGARQVTVSVPDTPEAQSLSHSFFSLLAIREENPDVYASYAVPGYIKPRVRSHRHPLQVGWDEQGHFNKPTVIHSLADVRANLFRQVLRYRDFDQVLSRLMIPPRVDESALIAIDWPGELIREGDSFYLASDEQHRIELALLVRHLFERGVILVAMVSPRQQIQTAAAPTAPMQVATLIGVSLDSNTFYGEVTHAVRHADELAPVVPAVREVLPALRPLESITNIRIVVVGWIGGMPLVLKRLLQGYNHISLTMIDDMSDSERMEQEDYLRRRISEVDGANARIDLRFVSWDYTDMEGLRGYVSGADRIILASPLHIQEKPHVFVASVLSDLMAVLNELDEHPMIFPVVDKREQAHMLQKQMEKFSVDREVHLVVPNEFYGTYVAHTSYHMYVSHNDEVYQMHRALRHVINDLMSDDPEQLESLMGVDALAIDGELPEDPQQLFDSLLARGYLWIGYLLRDGVNFDALENQMLYRLLPRELDFQCLRQRRIVINPRALPTAIRLWQHMRGDISELIVIKCEGAKQAA